MAAHPVIGIAGAGAVGGHYGLALLRAGLDVRFLARGAHAQAMQRYGLYHVDPQGKTTQHAIYCSDDPALLAGCAVIILACKTTQLAEMMDVIAPYVANAVLVTMQNGVEAPDILRCRFSNNSIIAASAFIGARIEPVGTIIHSAAGHIRLGVWTKAPNSMANVLAKAWLDAGVDAQVTEDMRGMLWRKMLWNCGFNAITALTQRYARDLAANPASCHWVKQAMLEAFAVANSEGITLDERVISQHITMTLQAGPVKTSMWQDVIHHRPTEISAMNGCIVRLAQLHGIAVPVNTLLCDLLNALSQKPSV